MWDLVHRLSVVPSIPTTAIAGNVTTNGANSVSILGYESLTVLFHVLTRTDGTYTPKLQLSADGTNFYDADATSYIGGAVPGGITAVGATLFGILFPSSSAANAAGIANTALIYARVVDTSTVVTTGGSIMADFILGHPRHSGVAV